MPRGDTPGGERLKWPNRAAVDPWRIDEEYGRVSGERRIIPGDIFQPVYGPIEGDGVAHVIKKKDFYNVALSPDERGLNMHRAGVRFPQLTKASFCSPCHQVVVHPAIKLEVAWDQYRASPAAAEGITCQQCHMSKTPGRPGGFKTGPIAVINGKAVNDKRQHADHTFFGPGYSIAHPGLYPYHPDAENYSMEAWLKFDYRAGWGTDDFEDRIDEEEIEVEFPEEWEDVDDRFDAREIVDVNLKKLRDKMDVRRETMEAGSKLDGPFFDVDPEVGEDLDFYYTVTNINKGHNLPSGSLGAQPQIWLNVALIDPDGKNIWESGYMDSHGDVADIHSLDVAAGTIAFDDQLFNLQTKFLVTGVKGTDREFYVPVNFDIDQIPFIRPAPQPASVLNHPPFIRMESRSLPPLSSRDAAYTVPGELIRKPGTYKLAVRLRSRQEPIYFMKFLGATPEMERSMNEWMIDIHPYTVKFQVREEE